ncbi:hypothetical protein F2P44_11510 [Massilia sp. CCM 8695]|uniref:Uncharacterized protein n=1 Tax=Massilia frigida TaxID=2609281 RepID=A0ABX0ND61_9BURK|nr:hypothetical protein [Massilia frigida]NHZ79898.1 hypothetical protein [Massilia frigida]
MHATKPFPDPADAKSLLDEADIGSGEKPPSQRDTEALIRQIPPLPPSDLNDADSDNGSAAAANQFDGGENRDRREHDASLERDEPSEQLDQLDPVPPKGQ